jgi:hypothetical protein
MSRSAILPPEQSAFLRGSARILSCVVFEISHLTLSPGLSNPPWRFVQLVEIGLEVSSVIHAQVLDAL